MHSFTKKDGRTGKLGHKLRTAQTEDRRNSSGNANTFMSTLHFSSSKLFRKLGALSQKKNKSKPEQLMYEDLKYYYEFAVL
jgi:hypothetical protein